MNAIEQNFYIEENFDPKAYELQVRLLSCTALTPPLFFVMQKLLASSDANPFLHLPDVTTRRDRLDTQLAVVRLRVCPRLLPTVSFNHLGLEARVEIDPRE